MMTVLTGIKPTGTPHIGNYVGAIKPALELAADTSRRTLFFIADYHALTSVENRKELSELTYEVAATWLACGLDPARSLFYRQSDVPETFELSWLLACRSSKGLMNRAHAYKARVAENREAGRDEDDGVNIGLYTYPILMAADILLFRTNVVPVGEDQVQHVEMARDLAESFNRIYGPVLTVPKHQIGKEVAAIAGLDGRKMSKSYKNTIPLFGSPKEVQALVARFKTDSSRPEEPKDPNASALYLMYREVASEAESKSLAERLRTGIGWGDVKKEVGRALVESFAPKRQRYEELMADKSQIDRVLEEGARKARKEAQALMREVREAIGAKPTPPAL
jgi:tryptophanyl-tRNA synthetase